MSWDFKRLSSIDRPLVCFKKTDRMKFWWSFNCYSSGTFPQPNQTAWFFWQQKLEDSNHASPTTRRMRQVPFDDSELRGPWFLIFRWYLITSWGCKNKVFREKFRWFQKMVGIYPTTMGIFLLKMISTWGVLGGYHHFRKHPYISCWGITPLNSPWCIYRMKKEKRISLPGVGCRCNLYVWPEKTGGIPTFWSWKMFFSQQAKEIRQGDVFGFGSPIWL